MAHELDSREDGTGAMFSVRETPWHRLGTVLQDAPSLEQALELAGANFDVELQQLSRLLPDGGYEPVDDAYATVRDDRNEVLGTVGGRYTPLQNRDAFRVLEPLVGEGLATYETGGTLRGGRDVWVMVRLNLPDPLAEQLGTEVAPYAMISNNHCGSRSVVLQNTPVRVVCANTLSMALAGRRKGAGNAQAVSVRHTSNVGVAVIDAARGLWAGVVERYATLAAQYDRLRQVALSEEEFRRLVLDVIAPEPAAARKSPVERTGREEGQLRRSLARRTELHRMWDAGSGHKGDRSAWEAYGGVTESVDHDRDLWRVRSGELEALAGGALAQVKQRALDSLHAHAVKVLG